MADDDMDEIAVRRGTDRDGAYRLTTSSTPLRRPADPAEIAAVVAFLAGPGASDANGGSIPVDGGAMIVDGTSVPFHSGVDAYPAPRSRPLRDGQSLHRAGLLLHRHPRLRGLLEEVPQRRSHYKADVVILGGDMTGKALVPIVDDGGGSWHATLLDNRETLAGEDEVQRSRRP